MDFGAMALMGGGNVQTPFTGANHFVLVAAMTQSVSRACALPNVQLAPLGASHLQPQAMVPADNCDPAVSSGGAPPGHAGGGLPF